MSSEQEQNKMGEETGKWKKVEDDQTKVEVKVDEEPKQDKVDNEDKEEESPDR